MRNVVIRIGMVLEAFAEGEWPKVLLLIVLCVFATQLLDGVLVVATRKTGKVTAELLFDHSGPTEPPDAQAPDAKAPAAKAKPGKDGKTAKAGDLDRVIQAWPDLPEDVRTKILETVKAHQEESAGKN